MLGAVLFDPSAPEAGRWRSWLSEALVARGIPRDARLELQLIPVGGVPLARLVLEIWWARGGETNHARGEVLVSDRRLMGSGWAGWPGYAVGIHLVRSVSRTSRSGD